VSGWYKWLKTISVSGWYKWLKTISASGWYKWLKTISVSGWYKWLKTISVSGWYKWLKTISVSGWYKWLLWIGKSGSPETSNLPLQVSVLFFCPFVYFIWCVVFLNEAWSRSMRCRHGYKCLGWLAAGFLVHPGYARCLPHTEQCEFWVRCLSSLNLDI